MQITTISFDTINEYVRRAIDANDVDLKNLILDFTSDDTCDLDVRDCVFASKQSFRTYIMRHTSFVFTQDDVTFDHDRYDDDAMFIALLATTLSYEYNNHNDDERVYFDHLDLSDDDADYCVSYIELFLTCLATTRAMQNV